MSPEFASYFDRYHPPDVVLPPDQKNPIRFFCVQNRWELLRKALKQGWKVNCSGLSIRAIKSFQQFFVSLIDGKRPFTWNKFQENEFSRIMYLNHFWIKGITVIFVSIFLIFEHQKYFRRNKWRKEIHRHQNRVDKVHQLSSKP